MKPKALCLSIGFVCVAAGASAAEPVDYARDIQPILAKHCYLCHGPDKQKSDLRLDSVAKALEGGNSGPALVPGKSAESLLIQAVTGGGDAEKMPPEGPPLSKAEVDLLKAWIDQGAKAPVETVPIVSASKKSNHWAFQPLVHSESPKVQDKHWTRNPIDAFIWQSLEAAKLKPSAEADRVTLIRRLSLDLTGLPPSIKEVDAFLADTSADAYERLVERLLASPHYGEHWARSWLDLARYADSNGYTIDSGRSIWKYRDWVIAALNRDLPFDQFTIEQMAGDMLPKPTTEQIVATGFHRNTLVNEEGGTDKEQFRVEAVVDRVSTTSTVFLGLTVGCARCHDHKYDPISQREFYQLFALLNNADEPTLSLPTEHQAKERPALLAEIAGVEKRLGDVDLSTPGRQLEWEERLSKELAVLGEAKSSPEVLAALGDLRQALAVASAKRSADQKKLLLETYHKVDPERIPLTAQLAELKTRLKQLDSKTTSTLVMKERKEPRVTNIHLRGDFLRPGAKVEPGVPAVLPPLTASGKQANRLDLARWLVAANNPLTPRVTVNRIWQRYFGQGLVTTENDFGTQGSKPTHPELLDWLSRELIARKWSLKELHKLIVMSATYRQSSAARKDLAEADPYNKLLGRQARLRLEAEGVRDAVLAVSGLLAPDIGGPSVYPPQPQGIYRFTQNVKFWPESKGPDRYRRGLYTYFWRSSPDPFLRTFDAPDANTACTRRVRSNTPLQALTLANDQVYLEAAQALAARLLRESPSPADDERIRYMMRLSLAREPSDLERTRLQDFVNLQRSHFSTAVKEAEQVAPTTRPEGVTPVEAAAWTAVARVLVNLDEFITRE